MLMKLIKMRMHFRTSILLPLNLMLITILLYQIWLTTTQLQTHKRCSPPKLSPSGRHCCRHRQRRNVIFSPLKSHVDESPVGTKTPTLHRLWWGNRSLIHLISPLIDFKGSHDCIKLEYFFFFFFFNLHKTRLMGWN